MLTAAWGLCVSRGSQRVLVLILKPTSLYVEQDELDYYRALYQTVPDPPSPTTFPPPDGSRSLPILRKLLHAAATS